MLLYHQSIRGTATAFISLVPIAVGQPGETQASPSTIPNLAGARAASSLFKRGKESIFLLFHWVQFGGCHGASCDCAARSCHFPRPQHQGWSSLCCGASPVGLMGMWLLPNPILLPQGLCREMLHDTSPGALVAGDECEASPPATTLIPSLQSR